MSRAINVIVRVEQGGGWLGRLVRSLDAQSLPYDRFATIVVVAPAAEAMAGRLHDLAGRRPNLRVIDGAAGSAGVDIPDGDWTIDLGTDLHRRKPAFTPDALNRMVSLGEHTDRPVVLGRVAARSSLLTNDVFSTDRSADSTDLAADVSPAAVVASRGAGDAAVLGGGPVLVVESLSSADSARATSATATSVNWRDGHLCVETTATAPGAPADAQMHFALRARGSGIEYWLPTRTISADGDRFVGAADIDLRTCADGTPLAEGIWQLTVGVHGSAPSWTTRSVVAPVAAPSGLVDGTFVSPLEVDGALSLDVGARRASPVGRVQPDQVSITDSAKGTKVVVDLPGLVVSGSEPVTGGLFLDDFRLPAVLVSTDGRARIECYVSGLAGEAVLKTRFGGAPPTPTGLAMTFSPVGIVSVAPYVPPAKPAAPKPSPPAASVAPEPSPGVPHSSAPRPVISRLRHRVPERFEPAVQALARNKLARKAYRALSAARR